MENNENNLEGTFLPMKLAFSDNFLLENCIRDMLIQGDIPPMAPMMKQPILDIPTVQKSEKISIVCCVMGKSTLNIYVILIIFVDWIFQIINLQKNAIIKGI